MKFSTVLTTLIISSFFTAVVGVVTLRLSGDPVYGQPFSLVCYATTVPLRFATFYRKHIESDININNLEARLGTVSITTCKLDQVNLTRYNYSCSSSRNEISLIVPAENLLEHNTVWKCTNAEGPVVIDNNNLTVFVNVPVSSLHLSPNGNVGIDEFETNKFTCTTSFCRPQATISWWKNNVNITNTADIPSYDQNFTTGSLFYTGNRQDNGHLIVCKASNGYGLERTSQQSVVLNVRYAPVGSPSIANYSNGSIFSIIENTPEALSCSITGGNPLASLSWNCFDFVGSVNIVEQTITSNITLNVNRSRTGQLCQCLSMHELQGNRTAIIFVQTLYPPVVTPFQSPVKVVEGSPLEVVCRSDGNPIPDYTWDPLGEDIENRSRLYYHNITRNNRGTYRCKANSTMKPTNGNPVNVSDSKDVIFDVLYAPTVTHFLSPVKVIEHNSFELICRYDGNPTPSVTWSPLGEDTENKSRLYYHKISKNNSGIHRCTANNTMTPTIGNSVIQSDSADVTVVILYPPVVTPFQSPVKVVEGSPLEVVCRSDGNPIPDYTWDPLGEDIENRSRLYYHNITRNNRGTYRCKANSTMKPTSGNAVNVSDSKDVVIDVLYPPIVTPFQSPVKVVEGSPLELICRSDGNPTPDYTWDPLGENIENRSRLYYHNITRNNGGTYRCKANSTMRPTNGNPVNVSDSKDVVIDVLYRASISAFITKENNNTIMENDSLLLHCQVNSNPLSDIFLYYEDNNLLKEEKNALNLNYTKKAECLDAGVYTCHANNSIMNGYSASSDLQIMVACSPRFDHRKNVSTVYYTGLNSNVTLEVYVIAYPEPANITWHHRENETDMWQRVTYQPPVSGGLSSRILIQLTSRLDFGYYMVTLGNYLGKYNKTYSIIPESIPGVPKNISVTKRGPHSVTLEWAPGFAGGHPQHFIIEYARQSDEDWIKSDEILDVESPMQSYVLSGLQPKTFYQLRMYAGNKIGFSEKTQVVTATTLDSFADKDQADVLPVGAIAGGIPGAVVTVVLVILVVIFLRRRWLRSKDKDDNFTRELRKMERPESGLVDNPVYDSSGTSASSGAVGVEYAVVVKKTRVDDARNLYAEVNKKKNKKKGDIYENTDIVGRSPSKENVYANSNNEKTEQSGDNVYENPGAAASHAPMTNKDGLLYADLMLDPPTAKNGKPVIWGIENRTEYADIAYGKRGEPLPDRDEEKEKKNK